MSEPANRGDSVLALWEEPDFVRHARVSELVDAQAEIDDVGESYRFEVVAVGRYDQADRISTTVVIRFKSAMLNQIGIHDGINPELRLATSLLMESGMNYRKL